MQCSSLKTLGDHFLIENGVLYNSDKTEMYTWLGSTNNSSVNIVAPSSVNVLGNGFSHCSDILSIDLSRTEIKEIYQNTFSGCTELTDVTLPEGIKTIKERAFSHCSKLKNINLPNSIEEFGEACFQGCALAEVRIPENLEEIPKEAFADCQFLTTIFIPINIKAIYNSSFSGCKSIQHIRISEGYKNKINNIFAQKENLQIEYIRRVTPYYSIPRTGAYTHGRMRPCPYCGSNNVQTYCDGTAECESCGGEYTYWR